MKILIVEDAPYRQNYIKGILENHEVDGVLNAEVGLKLLKINAYDIVFLDHDLIGAKSGSYLTLNWYQNKDTFKTQKPLVVIHSMNMDGASKMENHLKGMTLKTERISFKLIRLGTVDLNEIIKSNFES